CSLRSRNAVLTHELAQGLGPKRLRQIVVHSCTKDPLSLSSHSVSRERNDWSMAPQALLKLPNLSGGCIPIHDWHLAVHQNEQIISILHLLEGLRPIAGNLGSV